MIEVVHVPGHVATHEVDHEALHDLRINGQGSEIPEVEVPLVAGVDRTAAVNAVDVEAQAIAEVAVEAVEIDDAHTADHQPVHLHDSKKPRIDHVHLQSLNSRHKVISLRFLHQVISHYHLRLQWVIKDLGHHHHLHTWRKVGFLLTLP